MDLEKTAIERLKAASDMSLRLYKQPLVITYSGGKDSDVLLHLAEASGIPFEALHSLTTALVDGGRRDSWAGGIGWIRRNLTSACSAITHG